ncbi:MAG: DUF2975 domain-containing protein [Clostridia bacterium]|nr:DUF2975 domain-containing protein [Clostridia bacterium]
MKILGKKSLSSKLLTGVRIGIVLTIMIMLFIAMITFKDFRDVISGQSEKIGETVLITGVFIAGFLFITMLVYLTSFFSNLKDEVCFDDCNIVLLKRISNLVLGGSIIYGVMSVLHIIFVNNYMDIITYNVFLWILTAIMVCASLGLKIFIEIYKKAIDFKKENDFTI